MMVHHFFRLDDDDFFFRLIICNHHFILFCFLLVETIIVKKKINNRLNVHHSHTHKQSRDHADSSKKKFKHFIFLCFFFNHEILFNNFICLYLLTAELICLRICRNNIVNQHISMLLL